MRALAGSNNQRSPLTQTTARMLARRRDLLFPPFLAKCWLVWATIALFAHTAKASPSRASFGKYADHPPNHFVPGGRLESVELLAQTASLPLAGSHNLVVAVSCQEGLVIVSTEPESPYLSLNLTERGNNSTNHNATSFTPLVLPETSGVARPPFARLSPSVWAVTAGRTVHSQLVRLTLHKLADSLRDSHGHDMASQLAHHLADHWQAKTQQLGYGRVLSAFALIVSRHELWRVDPTGQFYQCWAAALGRDGRAAEAKLVSKLQAQQMKNEEDKGNDKEERDQLPPSPETAQATFDALSKDEAVRICVETIQETLEPPQQTRGESATRLLPTLRGVWISKKDGATWYSNADLEMVVQRKDKTMEEAAMV